MGFGTAVTNVSSFVLTERLDDVVLRKLHRDSELRRWLPYLRSRRLPRGIAAKGMDIEAHPRRRKYDQQTRGASQQQSRD